MLQEELFLYVRRASRGQIAISVAVFACLLVAFAATLPFSRRPLPEYNAFIPVVDTALLLGDGITATILFFQASALRSRALVALATGYLFAALIIIPHALSFPGAFAPHGLIGGGASTTIWLYFFWHCGLPCAVIAYALLRQRPEQQSFSTTSRRSIAAWSIGAAFLVAGVLTVLATAGHDLLPPLMTNAIDWSSGSVFWAALCMVALLLGAIFLLARGRKALLDVWLMVAMGAWLLEILLVMSTSARYSLGWYSGRVAGMLSGVFVLVALLVETSRLYVQLAISAAMQRQQREGQLMSLDAVAAAIAHEVKQPVTAMVTNASAALIRIRRDTPDFAKVERTLRLIVDDGHRVADTIGSMRALFGALQVQSVPVDVNQLIRETLDQLSIALTNRRITVALELAPDLPRLEMQRLQIGQLFVNLLNNAIDAVGDRPAGQRRIVIHTETTEGNGIEVRIADTGTGISPEVIDRIFDAFFTTKGYGTGMGLPLCRSIVEYHGGKLWASSDEGRGATFHIQLPGDNA